MSEIRPFCKNCQHRRIPATVKQKFNKNVKMMFDECPMRDKQVAGCLIKDITIDWKAFTRWLEDNKMIDDKEIKSLKLLKLYDFEDKEETEENEDV